MADFPAAHSMDTDWFAVDADGNVGMFNSCEGGAVPRFNEDFYRATRIDDIEDFCQVLPKDKKGIIHINTEAKSLTQYIILGTIPRFIDDEFSDEILMIISSQEAIDKLKTPDNFILRFVGEPLTVYVNQVSSEIIDSMFSSGEILGGTEFDLFLHPHCLGLFFYDNYGQAPIPYEREGVPEKPLKIEDLPEKLQKALSKSNFENIHFAETQIIQPIEYTPCNTWGDNGFWVDSQGNDRKGSENL